METLNQSANQEANNLPLVVYLRGDEAYFEQFSLRADDVMTALQIKRSRLNQISGRELRVGKARIDHYLRAVYRPKDVEEYLNWTRATVTHKRSSEVLGEASAKLEQQSEALTKVWSLEAKESKAELKVFRERQLNSVKHSANESLRQHLHQNGERNEHRANQLQKKMEGLEGMMQQILGEFASIRREREVQQTLLEGVQKLLTDNAHQEKLLMEQQSRLAELQPRMDGLVEELRLLKEDNLRNEKRKRQENATFRRSRSFQAHCIRRPRSVQKGALISAEGPQTVFKEMRQCGQRIESGLLGVNRRAKIFSKNKRRTGSQKNPSNISVDG